MAFPEAIQNSRLALITEHRTKSTPDGIRCTDPVAEPVPFAIGGELTPQTVLAGYRAGYFPMPAATAEDLEINRLLYAELVHNGAVTVQPRAQTDPFELTWWSPDPRPVYRVGQGHLGTRLARLLRNGHLLWTTTVNQAFDRVVGHCQANRRPRWLTAELAESLRALHDEGWAHSVEVWSAGDLVGGAFGVGIGRVFSADSCFHLVSDASRVAMLDLERRLAPTAVEFIDLEWDSPSNRRLGAQPMPTKQFLEVLTRSDQRVEMTTDSADVRRLGHPLKNDLTDSRIQ